MIVPNRWKLVETTTGIRVFSSWRDESWRLSSDIVDANMNESTITIKTKTGSTYEVRYDNYGCTCMYNATVLQLLSTKPTVISVLDDHKVLNLL